MGLTQITTGGVDDNINIDNNTLKVDGTNNRVGIGTASPDTLVNLEGGVLRVSGTRTAGSFLDITPSNTGTDGISFGASYYGAGNYGPLKFVTGGSERLRIDSSGNVGIGTTGPTGSLSIASGTFQTTTPTSTGDDIVISGNQSLGIQFLTLASGTSNNNIYFGDTDDPDVGMIRYAHANNSLQFQTNASERMRIASSGDVLVGKTTTAVTTVGTRIQSGSVDCSNSSSSTNLATNSGGSIRLANTDSTDDNFSNIGGYNSNGLVISQINFINTSHSSRTGEIGFSTHSGSSMPERMRIDSSGNVGIGTSSPTQKLDVRGSVYVGTNIGINTTSPSSRLHALNASGGSGTTEVSTIERDNSGYFFKLYRNAGSGNVGGLLGADSVGTYFTGGHNTNNQIYIDSVNDKMHFFTNSSERMRIDSSGRVGIGTTSPGSFDSSADNFVISGTTHTGLTIDATSSTSSSIHFADGSTGNEAYRGIIEYQHNNDMFVFRTSATERMRITNAGFLRVSSDTGDSEFYANSGAFHGMHSSTGNATVAVFESSHDTSPYGIFIDFSDASPDNNTNYFIRCADSTQDNRMVVYSDGDIDNHDNSYSGLSDLKLKQDVVDAASQWDDIKDLRVRKFKFKSDVAAYGDQAKTLIGVVAQEAELVSPGLVKESPDIDSEGNDLGTVTKSVRYSVLYMKAIKALQEAMDRIETLETKVAALEAAE